MEARKGQTGRGIVIARLARRLPQAAPVRPLMMGSRQLGSADCILCGRFGNDSYADIGDGQHSLALK